jgi:hypothetical protein
MGFESAKDKVCEILIEKLTDKLKDLQIEVKDLKNGLIDLE